MCFHLAARRYGVGDHDLKKTPTRRNRSRSPATLDRRDVLVLVQECLLNNSSVDTAMVMRFKAYGALLLLRFLMYANTSLRPRDILLLRLRFALRPPINLVITDNATNQFAV